MYSCTWKYVLLVFSNIICLILREICRFSLSLENKTDGNCACSSTTSSPGHSVLHTLMMMMMMMICVCVCVCVCGSCQCRSRLSGVSAACHHWDVRCQDGSVAEKRHSTDDRRHARRPNLLFVCLRSVSFGSKRSNKVRVSRVGI